MVGIGRSGIACQYPYSRTAARMSQGAVSIVISRPNSAARVDSSHARVPYKVPSAICRLRPCTKRPKSIVDAVKYASDMKFADSLEASSKNRTKYCLFPLVNQRALMARGRYGSVTSDHRNSQMSHCAIELT